MLFGHTGVSFVGLAQTGILSYVTCCHYLFSNEYPSHCCILDAPWNVNFLTASIKMIFTFTSKHQIDTYVGSWAQLAGDNAYNRELGVSVLGERYYLLSCQQYANNTNSNYSSHISNQWTKGSHLVFQTDTYWQKSHLFVTKSNRQI